MALAVPHLAPGKSLGQRELNRIAKARSGIEQIPTYSGVQRCLAQPKYASETFVQ